MSNTVQPDPVVPTPMPQGEKVRYNWIDQARGFVMVLLVITELMPNAWRQINVVIWFFFSHPPKEAHYMDFYDVGVPAFLFIIGLLMSVSFKKRTEAKGAKSAVLNALLRWGSIFLLGELIVIATWDSGVGETEKIAGDVYMFVVSWDVINSIGFVGLLSIPFMFLSNKNRLIIAYAMMTFYQIMLFIPSTYWREYALASVHGGVLGGIFVMTAFILIGSCVGEYFIMNTGTPEPEKKKGLLKFMGINLGLGILLWLIPGGYPNKRESTMAWATISLAVIIAFAVLFSTYDYAEKDIPSFSKLNQGRIVLFKAFGENPFLIYILTVVPYTVLDFLVGGEDFATETWFQFLVWLVLVLFVSTAALILYKKKKVINTTKVAIGTVILLLILVPILL